MIVVRSFRGPQPSRGMDASQHPLPVLASYDHDTPKALRTTRPCFQACCPCQRREISVLPLAPHTDSRSSLPLPERSSPPRCLSCFEGWPDTADITHHSSSERAPTVRSRKRGRPERWPCMAGVPLRVASSLAELGKGYAQKPVRQPTVQQYTLPREALEFHPSNRDRNVTSARGIEPRSGGR